jgi:GAF domain-containing protein
MSETNSEIGARTLDQLEDLLATREREISALERATCAFGAMHHSGESIYYSLAQQAAGLLQAEVAFILLYEPEQQLLVGQSPAFGVTDEVAQAISIPASPGSPLLHLPGVASDGAMHDAPESPAAWHLDLSSVDLPIEIQSALTASLRHDAHLLGAVQVCNKSDGSGFGGDDARLLSIFANQAAVAIENARLLNQAQRHAARMASLYTVASALAEAAGLDEMLESVMAELRRVLNYDGCTISLATDDGQALRVRAADGEEAERLLGIEYPMDQGINAWIYRRGQPTLVSDADRDPRRMHIEGLTDTIRAAIGAPLVADGHSFGTIYVTRNRTNSFGEADLQFLSLTAAQVAAAVQRARLLEQAQLRAKEMESISTIGAAMASSLDVEHVLQTIYEQASLVMDTRAFFTALYDKARQELHFDMVYDKGERLEPFVQPLADNQGLTAHVIRTCEPLLIRDMDLEADALIISPLVIGQPSRSWLGVPIVAKDQLLGVISVQSYQPYAFSTRQMRLMLSIADQAGVSLHNAHLYEAVQKAHQTAADQRDRLAHLHRVVAQVQRTDDLPAKLQIVADGLHKVGWGRVWVSLCNANLDATELVCAGFAPEAEAELRARLLPGNKCEKWFGGDLAHYQIGHSYYLPWSDPWVREHIHGVQEQPEETEGEAWHTRDLLYVPLYGREKQIVAAMGLYDPRDRRRPTAESLHIIELFAQETALAIDNSLLLANTRLLNTDLQEMVDVQGRLLQTVEDLASPVVPIVDGVIVLPLVGHLDERRASQILRTLRRGIEEHRASVAILDITGVPIIDAQVANHLIRCVRASRLLGAEAILVGIRPDMAQTLVALGVHFGDIVTRSDLQSGFQHALNIVGRRLVPEADGQRSR